MMFRCAAVAVLASLLTVSGAGAEDTLQLSTVQKVKIGAKKQTLPVDLTVRAKDATTLHVTATANLGDVQTALPKLLSKTLKKTCEQDIRMVVRSVTADGPNLRAKGRIDAKFRSCKLIKTPWVKQSADFDARIAGTLKGNCVTAQTRDIDVRASGVLGQFIGAAGLEDLIDAIVRQEIQRKLGERDNCFSLPPELRALETEIEQGAFADLGDGVIGATVSGTFKTSTANVMKLVGVLYDKGKLNGK